MKLNRLNTYHVQPQNPLFTSDSQHPPRSRHAVHLGGDSKCVLSVDLRFNEKMTSILGYILPHCYKLFVV